MSTKSEKIKPTLRVRRRVQLVCKDPSRTRQEFLEETNVNTILKKFELTGQLPDLIRSNPQFGDFSDVPDYQDSLNRVLFAQEQFAALSSRVRARFENDPAKFLAFASDPKNLDEMVTLGLATKRVQDDPGASKSIPPKAQPKAEPKGESDKG